MTKAEERALEAFPIIVLERRFETNINSDKRETYIQGYKQAEKDIINKACKWLMSNSPKYVVCDESYYSHYANQTLIDEFKKAMED